MVYAGLSYLAALYFLLSVHKITNKISFLDFHKLSFENRMNNWKTITDIRREYGSLNLDEENVDKCPIVQFKRWFTEISLKEINDPTAMTLSTVDERGHPDSRIVLLKELNEEGFIFYTSYQSPKALQVKKNAYAALNFYWPQLCRQVRVRGRIKQVPNELSDRYFSSRPISSQASAVISPQSEVIESRAVLENLLEQFIAEQGERLIKRPSYWGGYLVIPDEVEFWQGRDNRLHDRILYRKKQGEWFHYRIAP